MSEKNEDFDNRKGQFFMAHGIGGLEFEEESGEDTQNDENETVEHSTEVDSQVGEENENTEQSEHSEEEPEVETTMVDNLLRKSLGTDKVQTIDEEPRSSRGRMRKSQRAGNNKKTHYNLIKDQEEEYEDYPVSKFENVFKNTVRNLPNLPARHEKSILKLEEWAKSIERWKRTEAMGNQQVVETLNSLKDEIRKANELAQKETFSFEEKEIPKKINRRKQERDEITPGKVAKGNSDDSTQKEFFQKLVKRVERMRS